MQDPEEPSDSNNNLIRKLWNATRDYTKMKKEAVRKIDIVAICDGILSISTSQFSACAILMGRVIEIFAKKVDHMLADIEALAAKMKITNDLNKKYNAGTRPFQLVGIIDQDMRKMNLDDIDEIYYILDDDQSKGDSASINADPGAITLQDRSFITKMARGLEDESDRIEISPVEADTLDRDTNLLSFSPPPHTEDQDHDDDDDDEAPTDSQYNDNAFETNVDPLLKPPMSTFAELSIPRSTTSDYQMDAKGITAKLGKGKAVLENEKDAHPTQLELIMERQEQDRQKGKKSFMADGRKTSMTEGSKSFMADAFTTCAGARAQVMVDEMVISPEQPNPENSPLHEVQEVTGNPFQYDWVTVITNDILKDWFKEDGPSTYEKRRRKTRKDIRFKASLCRPRGPMADADNTFENDLLKALCSLSVRSESANDSQLHDEVQQKNKLVVQIKKVQQKNNVARQKAIKFDKRTCVSDEDFQPHYSIKRRQRKTRQACLLDWKRRMMISNLSTFPSQNIVSRDTLKTDIANALSRPPMTLNENLQIIDEDENPILGMQGPEFSSDSDQDVEFPNVGEAMVGDGSVAGEVGGDQASSARDEAASSAQHVEFPEMEFRDRDEADGSAQHVEFRGRDVGELAVSDAVVCQAVMCWLAHNLSFSLEPVISAIIENLLSDLLTHGVESSNEPTIRVADFLRELTKDCAAKIFYILLVLTNEGYLDVVEDDILQRPMLDRVLFKRGRKM